MATAQRAKGEATRQRILEQTVPLFLDRGYGGTSMADILAATGLTKGGFYFHFASKFALAMGVLDVVRDAQRNGIMQRAGQHDRAVDQIAWLIRAAAAEKRAEPAMAAMGRLCQELSDVPGATEEIRPYGAWIELTADLMRLAQAQGEMDPAVDPEAAAQFGVTSWVGLDQFADLNNTDITAEDAEAFIGFVFRATGLAEPTPPTTGG